LISLKLQNTLTRPPPAEIETNCASAAGLPRASRKLRGPLWLGAVAVCLGLLVPVSHLRAQNKPAATISADAVTFTLSRNNRIAFVVRHRKRVKKVYIERDDISVADFDGREKNVVEPDKFMPVPPPVSYGVKNLTISPDGRRLAATMIVFTATQPADAAEDDEKHKKEAPYSMPSTGEQVIALFDDDGHEIRVAGSKGRFIEQASDAAWLSDDQTVVYLAGIGPYKIARVRPASGKTSTLFEGHTFDTVVWDTARDQAFALGRSLSLSGRTELVQLDLIHETVREIARVPDYQGQLTVSSSGKEIGYFVDGDTIEVRDLAHPLSPIRVRTGPGKFEFSHDGSHILLKRGSLEGSGDLIWVGLHDNSWVPILHDLEFHDFELAPDGSAVVVMDPGKGVLKVYRQ
jgi:hypothetical protein